MEKIAKPIIGIILMILLAYIGLSNLFKVNEKITTRMEERAIESRQKAEIKKKASTEEKVKEPSVQTKLELQRNLQEEKVRIEQEKIKKETSKECQFWRLQKSENTTDKAAEKIKEYCD